MGKLAITYYHDIMRGYRDIIVHESGVKATEHFYANAQNYFNMPIIYKGAKQKLTGKTQLRARVGLRGFCARFLTEDEAEVYTQYGDDAWFDQQTGKVIAPIEQPEEPTYPVKTPPSKKATCHVCNKDFSTVGIGSHLAAHRRRNEDYIVTYPDGKSVIWQPKKKNP